MRIVCSPNPTAQKVGEGIAFAMYKPSFSRSVGWVGSSIPTELRRLGFFANPVSWDFLTIALAVIAADHGCPRKISGDGWTRRIDLCVHLQNPLLWEPQVPALEKALGFLTGDIWTLQFDEGGSVPPARPKRQRFGSMNPLGDLVCLFSGGMDSLVGAIDLVTQGKAPILVSQRARGDSKRQNEFAMKIGPKLTHLQLSHAVHTPGPTETSQRARSIIFLAYGLLAATAGRIEPDKEPIQLIVPENGYISINVPLTGLRLGTLSTRTTHPFFLSRIQNIWTSLGLGVEISNPYQFRTKGELLTMCNNQRLLRKLASQSTSCGRYARFAYKHCGRCIPCLFRRAAFLKWKKPDLTEYKFDKIDDQGGFDDVQSLAVACLDVEEIGVEKWAAGSISYAELDDPSPFFETVSRGIDEARDFLNASGVL